MPIEKDQAITLGTIAALAVAFCLFVWMPARSENRGYAERIEAARATLDTGPGDGGALTERDRAVKDLQLRVNGQDRYVPETAELASVLRSLTEAVRGRGVNEHELETLETTDYARYSVIPARLAFHGGFGEAFGVLQDIETMPRLIRVDRLEFRAGSGHGSATPTLDSSMRLSTFHSNDAGGGS